MKIEQLQEIIEKLETDVKNSIPMFAITVENTSNADNVFNIVTNATNPELVRQYGSAENFFENLYKTGVKSIRILPKKRNGTFAGGTKVNWKNSTLIQPQVMTFTSVENNPEASASASASEKTKPETVQHQQVYPALNGLSMADYHKVFDHQRLQGENAELKAKNELLEKENKRLEIEVLTNDLLGTKSVEKAKANAELLEKGQGYLPVVLEIVKNLRPATPPGLGQPQPSQFSQVKQIFLNQNDDFLEELIPVAKGLENQDFADRLLALCVEFKLVEDAGN